MEEVPPIDKKTFEIKVTTGLLIFLVLQTFAVVWWAASLTSEQKHIVDLIESKTVDRFTGTDGKLLQLQIDQNKGDVREIKDVLLRIEEKIDGLKS